MEGMIKKGRIVKEYKNIRIKGVENGFAICYDVEYEPIMNMMGTKSHFEYREESEDYSYGIKEVFEIKGEKKDSTLDRALERIKELMMSY